MRPTIAAEKSIFDLVADLRDETKALIRQEMELAKTELSEKLSHFRRSAVWLAIGGGIAYAGVMLLLVGLAFLVSYAFQSMGIAPALANFIGASLIGMVIALIGYGFIARALNSFSQESLTPDKTLHTLQQLKRADAPQEMPARFRPAAAKPSSIEMESLVDATQRGMKQTASELQRRLTPRYLASQFAVQIKKHPWRSSALGAGTSLVSFLLIKRKFRHT